MMKLKYVLIPAIALTMACGAGDGSEPATSPEGTTADPAAPAAPSEASSTPAVQETTLSLQVTGKANDDSMQKLAGAKIFVEPFSSPEAANPQPHVYFDREADGITDAEGIVTLTVTPGMKQVVHIESADGTYGSVMRLIEPSEQDRLFFVVTLLELQRTTVNVPESGSATLTLGNTMGGTSELVTLTIDAGDLVYKTDATSSGLRLKDGDAEEAVSGEIEVLFQAWDPFVDDGSAMPSDLATDEGPIASYGMFSIEFFKDGVPVNVAEGQTVAWEMTLNEAFAASAKNAFAGNCGEGETPEATGCDPGDHLNVYSMDGGAGLWIEDEVTKNYNEETRVFSAESTHFSHKNCDDPGPYNCNGCVDVSVSVKNRCGDSIDSNQANIAVTVSGSSSGNRTGCHNLPDALDNPSTPKQKSGSVQVSMLNPATQQVISESANYSATCNDGGLTGCNVPDTCDNKSFEFEVQELPSFTGQACSARNECGCAENVITELDHGLSCIGGSCQACIGSDANSRANDACTSTEECCRAAGNDLGQDLDCVDNRCGAP